MRALLLCVALLSACDRAPEGETRRPPAPAPETIALRRYFPISVGDRWRARAGDVFVSSGVSGIDQRGVAAIVDDAGTPVSHIRVSDTRVEIVSPSGESLTALLVAPLTAGRTWTYAPDPGVRCDATVKRTEVTRRVAGLSLTSCVEIESRCTARTSLGHTRTEVFCPDVGRVHTRFQLAGPNEAHTSELVSFRVRGGPLPPAPEAPCDELIVLPTDLAAACPGLAPDVPFAKSSAGACAFTAHGDAGFLRVSATKSDGTIGSIDAGIASSYRVEDVTSSARFVIEGTGCTEASARRLIPLLRSLVAR